MPYADPDDPRRRECQKRYREAHPDRARDQAKRWREAHPGWWRKYAGTPETKERQAAWHAEHRDERREAKRRRYSESPEKFRLWSRAHQTRVRGQQTGPVDHGAIVARDRGRCGVCGKPVARKDWSFDHIVPVSLGGPHNQHNLQLTHLVCNKRRGAGRLPAQMRLPLDAVLDGRASRSPDESLPARPASGVPDLPGGGTPASSGPSPVSGAGAGRSTSEDQP